MKINKLTLVSCVLFTAIVALNVSYMQFGTQNHKTTSLTKLLIKKAEASENTDDDCLYCGGDGTYGTDPCPYCSGTGSSGGGTPKVEDVFGYARPASHPYVYGGLNYTCHYTLMPWITCIPSDISRCTMDNIEWGHNTDCGG